ncbi:hypothetical protein LUZ60_005761 [Juncus effusus]|nr:hypothetical protein LUZ60_005761 [Juncus effusus]
MSKVPKWKVEKNKVKVVFRLQFHATHLPQTGWDKLFLSFIPAETGKPSAKTNKTNVRNGICKWSDPIYEATRLLQDPRSKKYDDKLYKLIIAMGSSRASILGEADINLAEFVDALKPSSISLPLHGCDFGTVLHVTVQILTTKTGFREFEQQSVVKAPQMVLSSPNVGPSSDEKPNARLRLKETNSESTEDGIDTSSHTSDSLHLEKTEIPLYSQNYDFTPVTNLLSPQGSWASDLENPSSDFALAFEENNRLRARLEVAESAFLQLKSEAKSLQRITDDLGAETQSLACQLAAELDSGQTLAREVNVLKTECSNLKRDVRELELEKPGNRFLDKGTLSSQALVLIENKVLEIRDKACIGFRAGFDFLGPDLEALLLDIEGLKRGLGNNNGSESNQDEDPLVKKEKMCELLQKLEDSKTENELLVKKMNQMERYYESFIHQLEESQKVTVKELETLREAESGVLQSQIEKLNREMESEVARFEQERKALERVKEEMERRAAASESALKRVRRNYTGAVERLQKDLELLSFQVLSMYETGETLSVAKRPVLDSDLNLDLKSRVCSNGGGFLDVEEERSNGKPRCIEIRADKDDEIVSVFVGSVQLRVFSDLLVGALSCVNNGAELMRKRETELENELVCSKESGAIYALKCDELAAKVRILEGKSRSLSEERDRFESLLAVEMTEKGHFEVRIVNLEEEFRVLREERDRFESLLAVEMTEKGHFEARIVKLGEESRVLREEINKLNKEKFDFESKLKEAELDLEASRRNLLEGIKQKDSFEAETKALVQEINALKEENNSINQEKEILEKLRVNFENKWKEADSNLEGSRLKLEFSSAVIESLQQELQDETEKLKRENNDLMAKLKLVEIELEQVSEESESRERNLREEKRDLGNEIRVLTDEKVNLEGLVRKTELDLQDVLEKFETAKEAEEIQRRENRELIEKLEIMEMEMSKITGQSRDFECTGEELERIKTSLVCCEKENKLMENELNNLRELKVSLESDLEASRRKQDVLSKVNEKLEREVLEVRESFSVSSEAQQMHVKSNSELVSKLELMEKNLSNCEDELERNKIRVINCEEEKRELENELEILREKKGIFENLVKKAESDLDLSIKTVEKLEQELNEVREIHTKENTDLVYKLEMLETELKDYKLDLVKTEGEKKNLETEMRILEKTKADFENLFRDSATKLDVSERSFENIQREFEKENSELKSKLEKENSELNSKFEFVQFELEQFRYESAEFKRKFHESERNREELEKNKEILENEIIELNLNLSDLNQQMEERKNEIVLFFEEKTKLRERIVELEKSNISMQNLISQNEENNKNLESEFENRLFIILEELIASDVEANYMKNQLLERNSQFNSLKNEFQNESEISKKAEFLHEAEILNLILKSKLEEQVTTISALKESKAELGDLRENQRVLTRRLSEQTLKTEEYKNLSIHLKEKSEEQSISQLIEKRETESLRIVFIKEQYESKIQEMKSQISASKQYSEEMLVKLQNSLDELEIAKKNEISLVKRIEEISITLSELERELKEIKTDKREIMSDYENLKAELECKNLNFDCLKEEKQKLEASFQECSEERRKLKVEVDLVKRLMENMVLAGNGDLQLNGNNGSIREILQGEQSSDRSIEKCEGEMDGKKAMKDEHIEKHQKLKVALSLFQKELEKLKSENISYLIPQEGDQNDPSLHGLERALSQLDTANEHLGSIFPSFKELSGSGNALERVLALELELAEALQEKKRTDTRFQSSFLKQHNDEEAIFQSFRDINELIQDMLHLKKRQVNTESELRDMHGRYSQLSIQFAELEGERQKLMMSLKNKSPRKS